MSLILNWSYRLLVIYPIYISAIGHRWYVWVFRPDKNSEKRSSYKLCLYLLCVKCHSSYLIFFEVMLLLECDNEPSRYSLLNDFLLSNWSSSFVKSIFLGCWGFTLWLCPPEVWARKMIDINARNIHASITFYVLNQILKYESAIFK